LTASRLYRICVRCIMDTTDPEITFDASGVCRWCRFYDARARREVPREPEARARLSLLVQRMKERGRDKPYDCLIGVSGGVDSTLALWELRKLGVRVLAVHLDNGWNSELAVDNIKKALDRLRVDLYTLVLDWEEFRDLQLAFLKASVPNAEIPTDHAITAFNLMVAREQDIPFVISGANVRTEAFIPDTWAYSALDLRHLKAIHRRFGTVPLRTLPTLGIPTAFADIFLRRIRWISILNLLDYNRSRAVALLEREMGWRSYGSKHYESVYTRFYQGYILVRKFGFTKRRAHLSNLVLAGEVTRAQALAQMESDDYIGSSLCSQDYDFVVKKLGLSRAEFEEIMAQPVRSHYDYPNHRLIYEKMPNLFKLLKKAATRP